MFKGLLHAAHLAMMIGQKLLALHHAGASKSVADELHCLMEAAHSVIDKYHTEAGCKDETDDNVRMIQPPPREDKMPQPMQFIKSLNEQEKDEKDAE